MKKILFFTAVFALLCGAVSARPSAGFRQWPEPMLLAPAERVTLASNETLEFRWQPAFFDPSDALYYDFRIYKSGRQVGSNLIYKEKVSTRQISVRVKGDLFESGKMYSWSLRVVGHIKGRSASSVFTLTKI